MRNIILATLLMLSSCSMAIGQTKRVLDLTNLTEGTYELRIDSSGVMVIPLEIVQPSVIPVPPPIDPPVDPPVDPTLTPRAKEIANAAEQITTDQDKEGTAADLSYLYAALEQKVNDGAITHRKRRRWRFGRRTS